MTNFYFNLNQIQSNPDGEPTVNRQSRLMSLRGKKAEKEQLSRDCLSLASELPLSCPRLDSLSLVSRQSDLDQVRAISAAFSTRVWKHVAMIFAVLVMSMANIGMAWGATATYVPLGLKTISTDEVVYCTAITAAGDPTTSWVVVPKYGTSSKGYTQITSTTDNGNPQGITDNLASTKSNVAMIQIKKDGNTYSSDKRVIHMHVKGITGVIAHGNTGSANYGLSIAVAEFNNNLSTFPSDITSGVRKSNGGCVLIKKDGLDASKEYIVSIYSSGGDIYFYAVEFIAGGGGSTTYSVTYDGNGKTSGSVPTDSNSPYEENDEVTVLGNTGTLVKTNYTFTGWNTAADGSGTHYDADDTFTMGTSNVTLYAEWQYSFTTHSPGTYTAAVGSGGYGKTLKTVSSRDYEVYLFSASSSKGTLYAGSASSITDGKALFSGVAANAEGVASDGWLIAKASTYAGSGSTNVNEFSGSSGALTTHYAGITSAQSIKMKISGYDQFSMIGRDGSTTSGKGKFIVKVDGVSQSITATTTDNNVYRFDISTGTHIIEITADGTDNVSRFRGFSLRIPAAACVAPNHVDITSSTGEFGFFGGETITLTAQAYSSAGTGSPIAEGSITGYQWKRNGTNISGATSKTLTISNCTVADAGDYSCVVSTGATCSTESSSYGTKVYVLQQYIGGETTYNFTRVGTSKVGTVNVTLAASTQREFKIYAGTMTSESYYMGNNGTIDEDASNWDFEGGKNNVKLNPGLGGTFTFTIDYTANGGAPKVSVAYPRKTIYLTPGVWNTGSAKFAFYYFRSGGSSGWTDFLTANDCGMSAEIPQWNGVKVNAVRLKNTCTSPNWDDKWNQTSDITISSNNSVVITDWGSGDSPYTYGTYSTPTYTISYNAGTGGSGSKSNETKTCGVAFTLPNSAVFTRTGYTQTGWAISDGGSQAYALGGTYTTNEDKTFYPVWTVNNYDLTWNLGGGTTTSAGTGIASSVSVNTTTSQAYGTALTAPTVTKANYTFSAWSPTVASTMPAEDVEYTATWTANQYSVTHSLTGVTTSSGATGANAATYGTDYTATFAASSGYALPNSVTVTAGGSDITASCTWTKASGTVSIPGSYITGNIVITVTGVAAAGLTAISADLQYNAADMANITFTSTDQIFTGLSTYNLFKVYGTNTGEKSTSTAAFGKNETISDFADDISTKSFSSALYITAADNTSSTSDPTKGAIEFITPSTAGLLYLYFPNTSSGLTLKKKGASSSTSLNGAKYKAMTVDANTHYFINGSGSNRGLYAIKYVSTYSATHTLSHVTATSGATGAGKVVKGKAYTATFTANTGYTLPSDVTVSIGGTPATKGTEYTWSVSDGTGTLTVKATNVTGNIVVTVTGTAAATYALNYECNGAESGCPSNTTASALPNPLPTGLTKDGYTFGGWFTDEELTVSAVAGEAMTEATTLYAKWTERGSECEDTPHAWDVIATGAKSYKVRISKVTEEVAIPVADATASNLTAYAGSISTNDNVTVQIADGGSSKYGYKFDGSNTYLKLVFSTPLVLNDTLVVGMTNASHNISFTTTAVRSTTLSTSGGKLIIPAALAGQSTIYLWRGSGSTMYLRSFAVKHACDALPSCSTPTLPTLSNQSLCEGADIAAWNATVTNASAISTAGETVTYSWKKKGNATELANTPSFDLGSSAAESQAGTYVVTATVSKAGYASSTATKEVTLTVNEATEVTAITADKATVYPGNSVTLTATANMDATWQWYTCTNAEGAGEAIISGAESASYTITSAGSAGTYYYKVKATGSCGIGSMVYTLTVSAAAGGDCETYYFFANADDATTNGVTQNADDFFSGAKAGTNNNSTNITVDGNKLTITKRNSAAAYSVVFTVPTGATASLYTNAKANSNTNKLTITRSSDSESMVVTDQTALANYTLSDIPEGTWTLTCGSGNNWYYGAIIVKVCSGTACTDPEVTASVNNSTACVGTSVTFSATGAHASATYQWQKYSGGAWTNIASATAATYNIASVATTDAMKYRVIASHECNRTSNEVTLNVSVAPVFADFTATRSVMATLALSITDVEASDATSYAWYKSANATYDAGTDTKVGTTQELLLASGGEAAGSTYYLFCVASNSCGSTTSSAITVNVTAFIEEDCATKGSEGAADFGFNYESGIGSGNAPNTSIPCWKSQGKAAYLTYTAPDGKYFSRVTMNVLVSSGSKAAYGYSTDGGTTWTYADLTGLTSSLADKSLTLPANVNAFRVGRNFDPSYGVTSGTFYLSKICFEYTDACTATTVTPDATSKTHTIGESFTAPIFTLAPGAVSSGTLTYSSSDEEIASVDESGNVTFNGTAGTVTITAAYAGATIADVDYCASEGSYTITVSCEGGAPKVVADGSVNMSGCNSSVTLNAKKQDGKTDFTGGSYQWFRNGEEIAGATGKSYTASQTGVYTVAYTSAGGCTSPSTNNATVTSATVEPEVTKLVPFHYYHVDKTYTAQMKDRHLFSVKGSAAYGSTGKNFKLTMSRNGGAETDMTTAASIWVKRSDDGQVDSVMIDLNKLSDKYSEGDELVLTCAAVDCSSNVSAVYKDEITINVIGATPTLALICSGTDIAAGTRDTKKLTVGGDFLTGYNVADLCQQTGDKSFDANTEWGLYTRLKENYIVTPVNGYAVFNKLNYEPFDILLLTDYPKASKSDAAKDILDDMAALCDYRPLFSFKTHMVAKSPSKWAAKGFTTSATENKADGRLNLNIVCYAHPMFDAIKTGDDVYNDTENTSAQLIYTMLSGTGHEGNKGMQGFEIAAAENFVTIGLTHYNATIAKVGTNATWTPGSEDRMLVTVAERQTNIEARMILFSLNCGAQSKLTDKGEQVVLACLNYLLETDPLKVADCSFTFDNGASNEHNAAWYAEHCPGCTGTKGDGLWSTAANWAPDYRLLPGEFTSVRIAAPVTVDLEHAHVLDARIKEGGQIIIPAGKGLDMKGTIRRLDGSEISPTENSDLFLGSTSAGNGSLIFNNDKGDTKATVAMYTTALADIENMSATTSTWQYIGTPHNDVARATYNYYDSWLYQYSGSGWEVIPNGGPLVPFRGYCVTHPQANHTFVMYGTLTATTNVDIEVPAGYTVIANSWVAPIDITTLTDDDMEDIDDKTIYFFNTGSDAEGENGTGTAPGTYVAVPKNAASYVGNWQIPSMQGFYLSSSTAGTLHLDYGRHVRPAGERTTIVNNPMYAPRRAKAADEEPLVLKMFARGSRYHDKLVVLEREDFTTGYDSGWDGEAWGGSDLSPQIYVIGGGRYDAVSAIPDFEGTVVAFRAGEDEEYTIDFIYDAENEPLYLFDTENNSYTQIVTGGAYHFTTSDKAAHSRFILTRHAPQIATGCENLDGGEGAKAKKLLIEDKMFIMVNGLLYDATGKVVK